MSNAIEITKDNFDTYVTQGELPILVDFWAPWCGPCRMVGPIVDQIAAEQEGKLNVGKVNVDIEQDLAMQFGVMSIPTLIVFKGGKEVEKVVGALPKAGLMEKISKHI